MTTKIEQLLDGQWQGLYASQSEADYALVFLLASKEESNEKIIKQFRESKLGQRPKAQRNDYVNHLIKCARENIK